MIEYYIIKHKSTRLYKLDGTGKVDLYISPLDNTVFKCTQKHGNLLFLGDGWYMDAQFTQLIEKQ